MTRRSSLAVVLAGALIAATVAVGRAQSRQADEQAIRKEIESIFQAFIDKDRKKLEETHGKNWRGYLTGSRTVIKGRDGYMRAAVGDGPMSPKGQGMVGYRIVEYDTVWYGDVAVVNFVADVDYMNGTQPSSSTLTLMDIYAREDGRWMQVASQTSYHPEFQARRMSDLRTLNEAARTSLLTAREAVWRAWYGGDTKALETLLPPELVTLGPGDSAWGVRDRIIAASAEFAKNGGRLTRLEFPRTDIQVYGNTAIIYTSYELDINHGGKSRTQKGKATEVFVFRGGRWLNSGWQLAPEFPSPQEH
jgi:ketosteroid isomerase-like protein